MNYKDYRALFLAGVLDSPDGKGFEPCGPNALSRFNGRDTIHSVGLQKQTSQDLACLEVGVHFVFLPLPSGKEWPDPPLLVPSECELRIRVGPVGKGGKWWPFTADSLQEMRQAYTQLGEPIFEDFASADVIGRLDVESLLSKFSLLGKARARLLVAEYYSFVGEVAKAAACASVGLTELGRAVSLKARFDRIIAAGGVNEI